MKYDLDRSRRALSYHISYTHRYNYIYYFLKLSYRLIFKSNMRIYLKKNPLILEIIKEYKSFIEGRILNRRTLLCHYNSLINVTQYQYFSDAIISLLNSEEIIVIKWAIIT